MTSKKSIKNSGSLVYYSTFAAQRAALLFSIGGAVLYWAHQVAIAINIGFISGQGQELKHSDEAQRWIDSILYSATKLTVIFSVIAATLTLALFMLSKKESVDMKTTVSGIAIAVFCIFVTLFGQSLYNSFLAGLYAN